MILYHFNALISKIIFLKEKKRDTFKVTIIILPNPFMSMTVHVFAMKKYFFNININFKF
jgi:hypothetical protein